MVVDEPLETASCLSQLESLSSDAMNVVLSCLTCNEFQRLSITSKRLSEAVSNSSHLYMNGHSYSSSSSYSPQQNMLHPMSEMKHPHPHTMTRRRSVEFLLPEDDLRRLLGRFQCLNSLHLQGLAVVGDEVVSILNESPAADTITHIFLHGCALSYCCSESFQLKNLQHVTICGGQIRARLCSLLKYSRHLQSLSIGQCSAMRDVQVSHIASQTFQLDSLTLQQCVRLRQPVIRFPKLETLNLSGSFGLTGLPQFACPTLKELDISFCVLLSGEQIQGIVSELPLLEELVMARCTGVQSLNLSSKTLRLLNLSFCSLTELRLQCPKLQVLEVGAIFCSSKYVCTSFARAHKTSACLLLLEHVLLWNFHHGADKCLWTQRLGPESLAFTGTTGSTGTKLDTAQLGGVSPAQSVSNRLSPSRTSEYPRFQESGSSIL